MPIRPLALLKDLLKVGILTPLMLLLRLLLPPEGTLGTSSFFFPMPRNPDEDDDEMPLAAGDTGGCAIGDGLYCGCGGGGVAPGTDALLYKTPTFVEPLEAKLLEKLSDGAVLEDVVVSAVCDLGREPGTAPFA